MVGKRGVELYPFPEASWVGIQCGSKMFSEMVPEYFGSASGVFSRCFRVVSGMGGSVMLPGCYWTVSGGFWALSFLNVS